MEEKKVRTEQTVLSDVCLFAKLNKTDRVAVVKK